MVHIEVRILGSGFGELIVEGKGRVEYALERAFGGFRILKFLNPISMLYFLLFYGEIFIKMTRSRFPLCVIIYLSRILIVPSRFSS